MSFSLAFEVDPSFMEDYKRDADKCKREQGSRTPTRPGDWFETEDDAGGQIPWIVQRVAGVVCNSPRPCYKDGGYEWQLDASNNIWMCRMDRNAFELVFRQGCVWSQCRSELRKVLELIFVLPERATEFCRHCGACIPPRVGEGTCPKCDPEGCKK